ncbi:hypothetical protein GCM10010372_48910 [Streptomyces tauricus]|nr:hypothetical protein GCM10010372_48910 [Streptomyces tauricus]
MVPESESDPEQPASSTAPAPAAPASKLLRRGPEGVRDGRVNGTADVLVRARTNEMGGRPLITVPGYRPGTHQRRRPAAGRDTVDGNTPWDRIPFDLTREIPTTAHAAEESPG